MPVIVFYSFSPSRVMKNEWMEHLLSFTGSRIFPSAAQKLKMLQWLMGWGGGVEAEVSI